MTANKFLFFYGSNHWGSNWHPAKFTLEGVEYQNTEQYMMAEKARIMGDSVMLTKILDTPDPRTVKALGRKIKPWDENKWLTHRENVMFQGCLAKFSQNANLATALINSLPCEIVEASPTDRIWGIGLLENDPRALDKTQWRGLNLLGIALMRVRLELLGEHANEVLLTINKGNHV